MIAIRPPFFGLRKFVSMPTLGIVLTPGFLTRRARTDQPQIEIRSPRLDAPTLGIPGGGQIPAKLTYR
jgi:hypothetical protein